MSKFIFISHCILAQSIMAGDKSCGPQQVKTVIQWALDNDINMVQMPCPEALYQGIKRKPHGFKFYNTPEFRIHCRTIVWNQASYMYSLMEAKHTVLGVIGVVFSPACSTIKDSASPYHPYGVYMDELEKITISLGIHIKFVCVTEKWKNKINTTLDSLIGN